MYSVSSNISSSISLCVCLCLWLQVQPFLRYRNESSNQGDLIDNDDPMLIMIVIVYGYRYYYVDNSDVIKIIEVRYRSMSAEEMFSGDYFILWL